MKSTISFINHISEIKQRVADFGDNEIESNKVLALTIAVAVTFSEIIMLDYCLYSKKNGGLMFTDALNRFINGDSLGIPANEIAVYVWHGILVREVEFNNKQRFDRFVFDGTIIRVWKWECV